MLLCSWRKSRRILAMVSTINIPGWLPALGRAGAWERGAGVGPTWTPISPSAGSFFHADQQPWKASEEERAVVCALRRATGFPLDDLTFVVAQFLPNLNRDAVYRILKAAGLNRLPPASHPRQRAGTFKDYELGFVHLDVKHLPKLRTADGELRKRYLFVAIDRRSRFVHLAVKDDETEASARTFLEAALTALPFQVTHVLTDRGSCFTAEGFEKLCRARGIEHRKTRPYTPRTNGMVERF